MEYPLWFMATTLILAGSLWLRQGIRQLLKWAASPIIGKLPALQQSAHFVVTKTGQYAIWQSRKTYGQTSVKMPTPLVASVQTGKRRLTPKAYSNGLVNGVGETRFQLFTFRVQPGDYPPELPAPDQERTDALEIGAYRLTYQRVLAILLTILGAAALIGDIVILY